jgi:hypothetical protein
MKLRSLFRKAKHRKAKMTQRICDTLSDPFGKRFAADIERAYADVMQPFTGQLAPLVSDDTAELRPVPSFPVGRVPAYVLPSIADRIRRLYDETEASMMAALSEMTWLPSWDRW